MTISLNTAFQALYGARELGLTQRFDSASLKGADETWIFIYGGSTGVGQFAIQLAKLSGYKVVTVASPRNHEFLRSLGADAVFDVRTSLDSVSILMADACACVRSTGI
jgi:NADPH:quinone reductase-like Zn-dependent oxidoreductase